LSTYLDASFVVSLYTPDSNTASAVSAIGAATAPLIVSELCKLEAVNSFRLRVFRKDATADEAERSRLRFETDIADRIFEYSALPDGCFQRAHRLSVEHTVRLGTRAADILHVAAALELSANSFFSFDLQQRKLAEAVGLRVNPV